MSLLPTTRSDVAARAGIGLLPRTRPGVVSAEAAWTPADLTGLAFWWNAQRSAQGTNGDPIATLEDLSGNGYDGTAAGTARGTWYDSVNGHPGVTFTTDDYYTLPAALAARFDGEDTPYIRVYVYTAATDTGVNTLGSTTLASTAKDFIKSYTALTGSIITRHRDNDNNLLSVSAGAFAAAAAVVVVRLGTTLDVYVDGTKTVDGVAWDNNSASFDQAAIGADSRSASGFLDATLREVIWATPASVDSGEITSLLAYLAAEWA